jgi:hypothetical protein
MKPLLKPRENLTWLILTKAVSAILSIRKDVPNESYDKGTTHLLAEGVLLSLIPSLTKKPTI